MIPFFSKDFAIQQVNRQTSVPETESFSETRQAQVRRAMINGHLYSIRYLGKVGPNAEQSDEQGSLYVSLNGYVVAIFKGVVTDSKPAGQGDVSFLENNRSTRVLKGCIWQDENVSGFGIMEIFNKNAVPQRFEGNWSKRDNQLLGIGTLMTLESGRIIKQKQGFWLEKKFISYSDICFPLALQTGRSQAFTGEGIINYENGSVYRGDILEDKRHGNGTFTWADGKNFSGIWKNDQPYTGYGFIVIDDSCIYEGTLVEGKKQGIGTLTYASGKKFSGIWKDDQAYTGKGSIFYADGCRYEGEILETKCHGKGILIYPNKKIFCGIWKQGEPYTGTGHIIDPVGNVYDGELVEQNRHGKGIAIYTNGKSFNGIWKDDHPYTGRGFFVDANENAYEGQLVLGKRHGLGILTYPNGKMFSGTWQHGKAYTGQGVIYNQDGSTYEGELLKGKYHGKGTMTLANGNILSGTWHHGHLNHSLTKI